MFVTGLGLSTTKGLVDLMNGEIWIDSKERQGTTFRVELEFEGHCFLVAEDNAINSPLRRISRKR